MTSGKGKIIETRSVVSGSWREGKRDQQAEDRTFLEQQNYPA